MSTHAGWEDGATLVVFHPDDREQCEREVDGFANAGLLVMATDSEPRPAPPEGIVYVYDLTDAEARGLCEVCS